MPNIRIDFIEVWEPSKDIFGNPSKYIGNYESILLFGSMSFRVPPQPLKKSLLPRCTNSSKLLTTNPFLTLRQLSHILKGLLLRSSWTERKDNCIEKYPRKTRWKNRVQHQLAMKQGHVFILCRRTSETEIITYLINRVCILDQQRINWPRHLINNLTLHCFAATVSSQARFALQLKLKRYQPVRW